MKILRVFAISFCTLLLLHCASQPRNTFQAYVEGEFMYMASPFGGRLEMLAVNRGDWVKRGQLLFKLDPEPQKSQLAQAQKSLDEAQSTLANLEKGQRETILKSLDAQIKQAQEEVNLASIRVKRFTELYQKHATDKDTLDAVVTDYNSKIEFKRKLEADLDEAKLGARVDVIYSQHAAVEQAKKIIDQAIWALNQKVLTSPVDAYVYDTYYKQGEYVDASMPILSLLAAPNIRILFFVPEPVLGRIHLGDVVAVSCDSCKKSYKATINYISSRAEYTPPVIYSRDNNYKLVYKISALPKLDEAFDFHPGQPVDVQLKELPND